MDPAGDLPAGVPSRFFEAIDSLTGMPPVGDLVAAMPADDAEQMSDVEAAYEWLEELAQLWRSRGSRDGDGGRCQ